MEYVKRKEALKVLGINYQTLYAMADRKEIDTIIVGKNKLYNINKYMREHEILTNKREKICYCRVSSNKQKEDLERQVEMMRKAYPQHTIIKDIGSGLNYNREGLKRIIDMGIKGEIEELVIAYKDRLTRFGYEMIENIIEKYAKGKIIILKKEEEETPTEELTKDVIAIMNVYVAKVNGLRKYKGKIKEEINKKKIVKNTERIDKSKKKKK
jgi:putative resolvase